MDIWGRTLLGRESDKWKARGNSVLVYSGNRKGIHVEKVRMEKVSRQIADNG